MQLEVGSWETRRARGHAGSALALRGIKEAHCLVA